MYLEGIPVMVGPVVEQIHMPVHNVVLQIAAMPSL